jgi:hypothetical protein
MHAADKAPGGSEAGQVSPAKGIRGIVPPTGIRLVIGLLIALVLASIMATTYISADHAAVAHNLPWGQVGSSPLTTTVEKSVSLQVHQYASQSDLEQAASQSKIYGGFVASSNTLIISEAASLWAPAVMPAAYGKAALQSRTRIHLKVVNKLSSADPQGAVPGIILIVLLIAGYLGATFAMLRTKTTATHHRVTALFVYAFITGLVIDLIAGPILGGYPDVGSHFWVLWPIFAFIAFAVALLAATLQSLIGPMGTLAAVVIVVFIGNPSTGGVNGVAFLPPFWQAIGVVLPPRNGLYLIRNTLYFGGNDITVPIIVLSIYVVVCGALVTLFSWTRFHVKGKKEIGPTKPPESIDPDEQIGIAAIPPG